MLRALVLSLACLALTACGSGWETSYEDVVTPEVSRGWGSARVNVVVPTSLTVSEANRYAPDADIVWREDPFGDRYSQVGAIVDAGARRAVAGLRGGRPITLKLTVQEFHALSEKARYNAPGGVHNIAFVAQVFDARTGAALTEPDLVRADLRAYTSEEAVLSERRGETQKGRITAHIERVLSGWLQIGPDPRGSFGGIGR